MSGAVLVAIVAAIGNLLQGWDNATIAGAVMYIKAEFDLEEAPTVEGLIVAMSLIGATMITTFSGGVSDWGGRRPMLIVSSIFYFIGGLVMLWSPNVYVLLLGRLLDGFGIGLAVTLVPIYISETAPPETRGSLNTLPQFTGSLGMFLSYCMVFGMSLMEHPNWRLMLSVLSIPSVLYLILAVFFLPESPRWLVSKGRMVEAKEVLQRLRGTQDVTGEMALLVEGLGIGGETYLEEYIITPADELGDDPDAVADTEGIRLYGAEAGSSWIARPAGQSAVGMVSRHGSLSNTNIPLMDPLVNLFGSVHENFADGGSKGSTYFPHLGSMFSVAGNNQPRDEEWDEEIGREGEDYNSDTAAGDFEDTLESPLMSRQTTSMEKDMLAPQSHGSILSLRHDSVLRGADGEMASSTSIGGGWQLAWKWVEKESEDGKKEGGFQRIYLHEGNVSGADHRGSLLSIQGGDGLPGGECIQAAGLVSQSALYSKELSDQHPVGPAVVHPSKAAAKGSAWKDLMEPGVKRALFVGVGLQILQQFSGINGVMYYTPEILQKAGVGVLLSDLGLSSASSSLLISGVTTLLMLPSIAIAMRLMDIAGRRTLLLGTIPVLLATLVVLVIGSWINFGDVANAAVSTVSVVFYFCFFVMGFGPVPNILCAEIFPTRVRGICIAICALTFWIGDIIVTYTLPLMLNTLGLGGVFAIYAGVCLVSWFFVFLKVPETKGMPLEVISEFFSLGARQPAAATNN